MFKSGAKSPLLPQRQDERVRAIQTSLENVLERDMEIRIQACHSEDEEIISSMTVYTESLSSTGAPSS